MRDTALRVHLKRMWLPKEDSKQQVQKLIREKPLSTLDLSLYQPLLPSVLDFQPYPCELLDLYKWISNKLASRLAGNWVSVVLYRRCWSGLIEKFFALSCRV